MKAMFEGIRVIDFTANISGPATTTFLADMGAEVIKVEKPGIASDGEKAGTGACIRYTIREHRKMIPLDVLLWA
jgi:crotonobetainyl-CoA:carnitine CoA-transferase CaiB-like acyl-CoA transferase